jgi:serine/threonine protein kinase
MPEPADPTPVHDRLLADRYELGELVGGGGMAEVYRSTDRLLDRPVAVKLFRPPLDPLARRRFDDEGVALARLAHPGLVSIYDVGSLGDRPFLVMEFIEGESLQSRLLSGPLPLDQVTRIGAVLAEALAHAHARGVVHRDVKPSNIMLDHNGMPHLTDFGIALLADEPRLTGADQILGTPAYLAPEQLSGAEIGFAVDVYALALVLLECLTGHVEYDGSTRLEAAVARLHRPPRIPDGLPPALADLLDAMTSTDALARPTAADCALSLRTEPRQAGQPLPWWADSHRPAHPERTTVITPVRARPRRALATAVTGMAAVAIVLLLVLSNQRLPTVHPLPGGNHAQGGAVSSTSRPGSTGNQTGARGPARVAGTLVANQHHLPATSSSTAPSTTDPATTTAPSTPPTTTSSPAPTTSTGPTTTSVSPTTAPTSTNTSG